ncbi:helix-turn-helix domain-containing protein [Rhizomonospora bruguierae]|uniref:helix-turn-helix domain-containing protein n=1 Tax=Rhizomonospora bruguierae TaxID=1581705 RepID=UPI001BCC9D7E|nr:AraC family transcriptional regulator [Micromonospora sp. NBRC 107566]
MVGFGYRPGEPVRGSGGGAAPATPDVYTATLRELSNRDGGGLPAHPIRLARHLLMLVTGGHGTHTVDFVPHTCRAGTLIWARPGQVIQYGRQPGLDAILVQWDPHLLAGLGVPAAPSPTAAGRWQLAGEDEDAIINEVSQLVVDRQRHPAGALTNDLLSHQLAVLILRVSTLPDGRPGVGEPESGLYTRLVREIEQNFAHTRRVEEYAGRLCCSVRTLTRACLAATGRSAKQVIDDRVALEARRLLACTELPVAEVGQRLGFTEATNFGRFFQREVGRSPGAFRADLLSPPPAAPPPPPRPFAPPARNHQADHADIVGVAPAARSTPAPGTTRPLGATAPLPAVTRPGTAAPSPASGPRAPLPRQRGAPADTPA